MSTDATGAEILNAMAVLQLENETKRFREKSTTSRIMRLVVAIFKRLCFFFVLNNSGDDLETSYSLNIFY